MKRIMYKAAPVISQLDFAGIEGELILIEYDDESQLSCLDGIFFTPDAEVLYDFMTIGVIECSTIEKAVRMIRETKAETTFIIHRIDFFNLDRNEVSRGSLIKGHLSLLGPKILNKRNVIITSEKEEHLLRSITDRFIDLKEHK